MSDKRLREYQEEMRDLDTWVNNMSQDDADLHMGIDVAQDDADLHMGIDVAQDDADETVVMIAYVDQGHTIKEWFLLKDNQDAYIEFLESLLED